MMNILLNTIDMLFMLFSLLGGVVLMNFAGIYVFIESINRKEEKYIKAFYDIIGLYLALSALGVALIGFPIYRFLK